MRPVPHHRRANRTNTKPRNSVQDSHRTCLHYCLSYLQMCWNNIGFPRLEERKPFRRRCLMAPWPLITRPPSSATPMTPMTGSSPRLCLVTMTFRLPSWNISWPTTPRAVSTLKVIWLPRGYATIDTALTSTKPPRNHRPCEREVKSCSEEHCQFSFWFLWLAIHHFLWLSHRGGLTTAASQVIEIARKCWTLYI